MRNPRRTVTWVGRAGASLLALSLLPIAASPASADPFEVSDDAGYQQLLGAGTAAQIVQFEQSVAPNPRAAASVAAIGVFAARNPLATEDQLSDFAAAYDALLASAYAADPDLIRSSHLLSGVRFKARVIGEPSLAGLDTGVGADVLDRLGLAIDASSRALRAVQFERAGQWNFANSSAFGRVLVESLMGFDAAGSENAGVAAAVAAYLRSEGIEPFPSATELTTDYPDIATARDAVPQTFAAFEDERSAGFVNVRADIDTEFDAVSAEIDAHVVDIAAGLMAHQDVYEAAANATDQALLDLLAAQREADMRRISGSRAAIDLNALLLAQSSLPDDRVQVEIVRDFSSITLQTDSTYSDIRKGIELGGSALAFAAAVYTGDAVGAVENLTRVASGVVDIAAPETPTPEQQIFDQVIALRQQVEDLRVEMNRQFDRVHGRFDSIDRQLNIIYTEMSDSLNQINETTRQIDANVEQIQSALVDVRVALNRIEQNLYGALFSGFLQDYIAGADFALGFRERTGSDLPFTGADSFNAYESLFFSWSTSFASDNTYAGPNALTLPNDEMASDVLNATPLGVNINNVRQFPASLGLPALSSARLVNPTIWADTAWSYAQLAHENPWYFAKINENSPGRIGSVIAAGDRVAGAMASARSEALFDRLALDYRNRATAFATIAASVEADCFNDNAAALADLGPLDPWAGASQSIIGTNVGADAEESFIACYGECYFFHTPGEPRRVWELFPPELAIAMQLLGPDYQPEELSMDFTWLNPGAAPGDDRFVRLNLHAMVWTGTEFVTLTHQWELTIDGPYDEEGLFFHMNNFFSHPSCPFVAPGSGCGNITVNDSRILPPPPEFNQIAADAEAALDARRAILSDCLRQELSQPGLLRNAGLLLSASQDLLDAYVSIALPETFSRSDVLRAALRGRDGLGLDAVDALFQGHYAIDTIQPPDGLETALHARIDSLITEAAPFLDPAAPDESHDYLEWTLANLRAVQANAGRLTADDSYATPQEQDLVISALDGVLANDPQQPGAVITATVAGQPVNGSVMMSADGSFTYMPDPGFTGQDSFAYFAFANLADPGDTPNIVTSSSATVVIIVCAPGACPGNLGCPADLTGDGLANVFDLLGYLDLWFAADPDAERTGDDPAAIDVFDLLVYLDDWFAGC